MIWLSLAAGAYLLARWPFMHASIIPFYLEFRPAVVIVPLAGVLWGPVGALGVMVGSLLGDRWFGYWDALSGFRAIGHFLFAWSARRLWDRWVARPESGPRFTAHWNRTWSFLLVAWPGCFLAAAWPAWGADVLQIYPFPYIASLSLLNNLVFCTLLGPACYRIVARQVATRFGTWPGSPELEADLPRLSWVGMACHLIGSLGACTAGFLTGGLVYRLWPTRIFVHGTSSGPMLTVAVLPLLMLQVASLFMVRRKDTSRLVPGRPLNYYSGK